jgi:inhibitor of KinA
VSQLEVRCEPFGDDALLVTLPGRVADAIEVDTNRRVHLLADALRRLRDEDPRLGRPVAGFSTVLVPFDPLEIDAGGAAALVAPLAEAATAADLAAATDDPARTVTIPIRYGGPDGPDLADVAAETGLRPADVVEIHSRTTYRVFVLGFAPGFAYLGSLAEEIAVPRRATPRERVPAGSVAIAGRQTAVYPFATPGGWRLIGRTDMRMWDLDRASPALLVPGDTVRFEPVRDASVG